jgi:hypothetical protein
MDALKSPAWADFGRQVIERIISLAVEPFQMLGSRIDSPWRGIRLPAA